MLCLCLAMAAGLTALTHPAGAADSQQVGSVPQRSWEVDGTVRATLVVGDTLYVGGTFTRATSPSGQTVARANVAAFSMSTGALLTGWRADTSGSRPEVMTLETDGNALYIGGSFSGVSGTSRGKLVKVSLSTGALDTSFAAAPNGDVKAVEHAGGSLYVGGSFSTIGGASRTRVAKLSTTTGAADPAFVTSADGTVRGLRRSPDGTRLYVAGNFGTLGGAARAGLGVVDAATGQLESTVFYHSVQPMFGIDLSADGTQVFGAAGEYQNAAVAWNASTGSRQWKQTAMGDVQAIDEHDGAVYFGFHEGFEDDLSVRMLRADATSGLIDPGFKPSIDSFYGVWSITAGAAGVVAGGEFSTVSGVRARGFAIFPGATQPTPTPTPTETPTPTPTETPTPTPTPTAAPPTSERVAIAEGSTWDWRYAPGAPETDWNRTTSHPATGGWRQGSAVLGFGHSTVTTDINTFAKTADRPRAAYFTKSFSIDPGTAATRLVLHSVANDGAVFYVNGVEVGRANMPAGPVDHLTYAHTSRSTAVATSNPVVVEVPQHLLTGAGTFVIAVETHLNYRATTDVTFDLQATVTTSS